LLSEPTCAADLATQYYCSLSPHQYVVHWISFHDAAAHWHVISLIAV
jgi:hypothetical protein